MTPKTKEKVAGVLDRIGTILKCGGEGSGIPGPCPSGGLPHSYHAVGQAVALSAARHKANPLIDRSVKGEAKSKEAHKHSYEYGTMISRGHANQALEMAGIASKLAASSLGSTTAFGFVKHFPALQKLHEQISVHHEKAAKEHGRTKDIAAVKAHKDAAGHHRRLSKDYADNISPTHKE